MREHDDLLSLGTLLPTLLLMKCCLNEWIRLDRRRLTASAQIVLCLCRMRPNVTTMVRDCNTLLNALVRGTKTEAEKGFLPNRRKDGCSKRLGTTRVLLFITTTVRACNKPLTSFVRGSKTEALPAQQTREWMHEETSMLPSRCFLRTTNSMWEHVDLLTLGTFVACLLFDIMVHELMDSLG